MRSVNKKIACISRIIAAKLKARTVIDLLMQVYMLTSEYEEEKVEEFCDGKVETNTTITGKWYSVNADESYQNIFGQHRLKRINQRSQMFIDCCKRSGLLFTNT
jgi:hypothetical protein